MNLRGLRRHAAAGYHWLRPRLSAGGGWNDEPDSIVDAYYKVPWCLAVTGATDAAHQNINYIEARFLQRDGDLVPISSSQLQERYPLIPHAHVIIGALLVGRQELAKPLLNFLSRHRLSVLGAWGDRVDGPIPQRVDAISTACIGLSYLDSGHLDEARGAAMFLERLLEAQPLAETDFFTTMNGTGELITEFSDARSTVNRRVTFSSPFQVWHAIGFPIMLLARLFEVDGDPKWQRLAERFVAMFDRCEQAWIDLSVGKAAWGFAVLYRATGDTAYRRRALRATRGIVSWQDADGGWLTCLDGIGGTENAVTSRGYEISTELVTWLAAVGGILAEREGSRRIPPAQTPDRRSIELWAGRAERFMARRRRRASAKWQRMRNRARPTFTRLQRT